VKKGITFGAFDLFHAGHVLMLKRIKSFYHSLQENISVDISSVILDRSMPTMKAPSI